ncbi:MAG: hypothetical protein OEV78_03345 [Spirochaetia bacterium]|nr:hypothetical protein [Spirochaetia bacterium]
MGKINLKNYFKIFFKQIQCIAILIFSCYFSNALYSQNIPTNNADSNTVDKQSESQIGEKSIEADSNKDNSETQEKDPEAKAIVPKAVYTNPAMQGKLNEQYRWTPEDPSFLYETRHIPDHINKQEFLSSELEKVEIREQIKEQINFRKSLDKIKIRLPDMTQTLVLVSIIIIVLVYRSQVRKHQGSRK